MWGGILCGVEFHSKWGGMSKIVILYEFFQFSEMLAEKRIAPLNSSNLELHPTWNSTPNSIPTHIESPPYTKIDPFRIPPHIEKAGRV